MIRHLDPPVGFLIAGLESKWMINRNKSNYYLLVVGGVVLRGPSRQTQREAFPEFSQCRIVGRRRRRRRRFSDFRVHFGYAGHTDRFRQFRPVDRHFTKMRPRSTVRPIKRKFFNLKTRRDSHP